MKLKRCSPKLNFVLIGKNSEARLNQLIEKSVFREHVKKIDIIDVDQGQTTDKENSQHRVCKISSQHACIVSGLKCLLTEQATDFAANVLEDYGFNLEAKPFKPKPVTEVKAGLDLSMLNSAGANSNKAEPVDPVQQQLERKRQISQMYQYYNYLIFEKNKESFNDINPDLRKMTYKYD